MERTAKHLLGSPNPAQLEMRILANHGADQRFAFLKGRWSRAWKLAIGRARVALEEKKGNPATSSALSGLAGYEGSDSESSGGRRSSYDEETLAEQPRHEIQVPPTVNDDDESIKQARRARAREWAEKRRAARSASGDSST